MARILQDMEWLHRNLLRNTEKRGEVQTVTLTEIGKTTFRKDIKLSLQLLKSKVTVEYVLALVSQLTTVLFQVLLSYRGKITV